MTMVSWDGTPLQTIPISTRTSAQAGAALLDEVHAFVTKYVSFAEPAQADAVTLWVVHTHCFAAADTTPRLAIQSAEKQSGKTRLLETVELLVCDAIQTASISPAALFRIVTAGNATLLIDEVDTLFNAGGRGNEDLRGLLNAGYRRGSSVMRAVGKGVEKFGVFAPVALAGIGKLPDTVQDRSIVIRLKRRRLDGEPVAKLRWRDADADAFTLKSAIQEWAAANVAALSGDTPRMPDELGDRAQDVWEPLIAIANRAGPAWSERAAAAALELSGSSHASASSSLLGDIRKAFAVIGAERVTTADLIAVLKEVDVAKWGSIDARKIAGELKRYEIAPQVVGTFRGYVAADFDDAFGRYL